MATTNIAGIEYAIPNLKIMLARARIMRPNTVFTIKPLN